MHKNSGNTNLLTRLLVLLFLLPLLLGGCATCTRYATRYENRSRCFDHNPDGSCHYYTTEMVSVDYCVEWEKPDESDESEESEGVKASGPSVSFVSIGHQKFTSRNKPASVTNKSMAQLIMEGYVEIGYFFDVNSGNWTNVKDRALEEAGRAGGDVVLNTKYSTVFRKADDADTETLSLNLIDLSCDGKANDTNAAAKLIHRGARMNVESDGPSRRTALITAAACRNSIFVKFLLQKGANVNAKNSKGKTALMEARGNEEIRRLLINAGARE